MQIHLSLGSFGYFKKPTKQKLIVINSSKIHFTSSFYLLYIFSSYWLSETTKILGMFKVSDQVLQYVTQKNPNYVLQKDSS